MVYFRICLLHNMNYLLLNYRILYIKKFAQRKIYLTYFIYMMIIIDNLNAN